MFIADIHGEYQAGISVSQIASEGYQGLIVKASEGLSTLWTAPSNFEQWIAEGRANNMVVGAYHWLNSSNPVYQLEHFLRRIESVGGPEGLLCCVDVEDINYPPHLNQLEVFVDEFNMRTGHHPLFIYSGNWWWSARGWQAHDLGPLWDSHYVDGTGYGSVLYEKVPDSWWKASYGGWSDVTMLQFTSKARVAGQSIDASYFRGSPDELRQFTTNDRSKFMTQLTGPDPFDTEGKPNGQAAELRDTFYLLANGFQSSAAGDQGVIARLARIESTVADLAARPPTSLSDDQISLLATAITSGLLQGGYSSLTADEAAALVVSACKRALREGSGT